MKQHEKRTPIVADLCAVCGSIGYGYSHEGFFRVTCDSKGVEHCSIPPCGDAVTAIRVWNSMQAGEDPKDVIARVNMTEARVPATVNPMNLADVRDDLSRFRMLLADMKSPPIGVVGLTDKIMDKLDRDYEFDLGGLESSDESPE